MLRCGFVQLQQQLMMVMRTVVVEVMQLFRLKPSGPQRHQKRTRENAPFPPNLYLHYVVRSLQQTWPPLPRPPPWRCPKYGHCPPSPSRAVAAVEEEEEGEDTEVGRPLAIDPASAQWR